MRLLGVMVVRDANKTYIKSRSRDSWNKGQYVERFSIARPVKLAAYGTVIRYYLKAIRQQIVWWLNNEN